MLPDFEFIRIGCFLCLQIMKRFLENQYVKKKVTKNRLNNPLFFLNSSTIKLNLNTFLFWPFLFFEMVKHLQCRKPLFLFGYKFVLVQKCLFCSIPTQFANERLTIKMVFNLKLDICINIIILNSYILRYVIKPIFLDS